MYFRLGKKQRAKQDLTRFMAMTGLQVVPERTPPQAIGLTPGGGILTPGAFQKRPDFLFRPGR
jgi:hypothetical protein